MLKLYFFLSLLLGAIFISCTKEPVNSPIAAQISETQSPPEPPANPANAVPNVFAGSDIYLVWPVNSCTLIGSAQYPQNIQSIMWNKISGPGSPIIETPVSFDTKVGNLEKGIYVFELTATDKAGLTGRDTVSIFVLEAGPGDNELIFKDLRWVCPMGCHIRIENFHSFVPVGTAFRVYIKRDHSNQWFEVMNMSQGWGKYVWTIYNKGLEILEDQTEYPSDSPDIKITF